LLGVWKGRVEWKKQPRKKGSKENLEGMDFLSP